MTKLHAALRARREHDLINDLRVWDSQGWLLTSREHVTQRLERRWISPSEIQTQLSLLAKFNTIWDKSLDRGGWQK